MPAILMLGDFTDERIDLASLCKEFGWAVRDYDGADSGVVAVVVDVSNESNSDHYLNLVKRQFSHLPVIIAKGFHTGCELDHLEVFDMLLRPLDLTECRQTFRYLSQRAMKSGLKLMTAA
jgi:hypothetical protein